MEDGLSPLGGNYTIIVADISGYAGSSLCFNYTLPVPGRVEITLSQNNQVSEVELEGYCGIPFSSTKPFPRTEITDGGKQINTGFSCHCEGSTRDYNFKECPPVSNHVSETEDQMFPYAPIIRTELCMKWSGQSDVPGCLLGTTRDWNAKFYATYESSHVLRFSDDPQIDSVFNFTSTSSAGICSSSQPLSESIPTALNDCSTFPWRIAQVVDAKHHFHDLSDYIAVTRDNDFSNISNVHLISRGYFNKRGQFDPRKLCYIQYDIGTPNTGAQFDQAQLEDLARSTSQLTHCNPSTGELSFPSAEISNMMTPETSLSNVFNAFNVYTDAPNRKTYIRTRSSYQVSLYVQGHINPFTTEDLVTVTLVSQSCADSIEDDGFKCTLSVNCGGTGFVYVFSPQSGHTIYQKLCTPGPLTFTIRVPVTERYEDKLFLCVTNNYNRLYRDSTAGKCANSTVHFDRQSVAPQGNDTDSDVPTVPPDNRSGSFWHSPNGSWTIGGLIITILMPVVFVVLVVVALSFIIPRFAIWHTRMQIERAKRQKEAEEQQLLMMRERLNSMPSEIIE